MLRKQKIRYLSGALAILLSCSAILSCSTAARAAESSHPEIRTKDAATASASPVRPETKQPPRMLRDVRKQLEEDEVVQAGNYELAVGDPFDIKRDFTGIKFNREKVAVRFKDALDEILYFAIDYDLMDGEISTTAQQYFRGVRDFLLVSYLKYKAGVYGSRNVCSKISTGGLAKSSFVSDMSTGFSGNMGYRIPANWAFDQFSEYEFYYAEGSFGLDKDTVSRKYEGFDHIISSAETIVPAPTMKDYEEAALKILRAAKLIPVPQIGIEFNKEFTIDLGPVTVTFSASTSDTFFVYDEPATWQDITVANDSFSVDIMNLSTNLFGKLDATLKANCGLTGPTISFDLATAVGNGVVHYGMKLRTDGNLDVYYKCEKILWASADGSTEYKVYVQMKYTFQSTVSPGGDEPDVTYDYEPVTNESPDISVAMALIFVAAIVIADAASGGTLTELIPLIISTAKLAH